MPGKLSREGIVAEAIALLNEGGLAAVSLRKIAARLDARAPSLARHVGDKETLLAMMSSTIFRAALAEIPPCATWPDWLRAFGRTLWRKHKATRSAGRLFTLAPPRVEFIGEIADALRLHFAAVGLDDRRGFLMQASVQALIIGWDAYREEPMGAMIETLVPIDPAFAQSLDALVRGFETG